jgi:hypothetical protein
VIADNRPQTFIITKIANEAILVSLISICIDSAKNVAEAIVPPAIIIKGIRSF